jgi:16S rRNA (guanine966-N2)-methyltransferase
LKKASPGTVRIVGGLWRGRKIPVPAAPGVRPTAERAREAIFNRLVHAGAALGIELGGAQVVDVFAGSGALGLEALSRGAAAATFIEAHGPTAAALRQTIAALDLDERARVLVCDATALPPADRPCDLAFLDPPYGADLLAPALASLVQRGWLKTGALIVAETEAGELAALPASVALIDQRRYGRAAITFLRAVK